MRVPRWLLAAAFIAAMPATALAQANFDTSLHGTRAGKPFWYNAENGGFESFTNVPISELGCVECHGPTDADGVPHGADYTPSCVDCHPSTPGDFFNIQQDQCLSCHGRQKTEAIALGYSDVHRDMGFNCWDCHTSNDMHGSEVVYDSMLQPGAIEASCEGCHDTLEPEHSAYDPHEGKLHCSSCHSQTVISCYNCHFESQVLEHVKRAKQPIHDFILLVNRDSDGKVGTGSFQSLTYEGNAFVAFGPFASHTITAEGRTCQDCHVNFGGDNVAIEEYNETGMIKFVEWDDVNKMLSWKHGVVPMPEDYLETFRMDFLTYTGDPADPPPGDPMNWTGIDKDTWDGSQMLFATPLTEEQMAAIGMVAPVVPCDPDLNGDNAVDGADLGILLGNWGGEGVGDLNGDLIVDGADLGILLGAWGPC